MALDTYGDLKSAIADYAARADMTSVIPTFVLLAESMFNNGDRAMDIAPLRTREMESQDDLTVVSGAAPLPSDFLEAKRVLAATSPERVLEYATPDWLAEAYPSGQDAGAPRFYSLIGESIITPVNVELTYWAKVPGLTSTETNPDQDNGYNWLLRKAPNVYLFGSLYQMEIYKRNLDGATAFQALVRNAMSGLQTSDIFSRSGTASRRASGAAW